MKKLLLIGSILILLSGCKKDPEPANACDTPDPVNNVGWLKRLAADQICEPKYYFSIVQATYQTQTVFYGFIQVCPGCDMKFSRILKDCSGRTVKQYGIGDNNTFDQEVTNRTVIYTCKP